MYKGFLCIAGLLLLSSCSPALRKTSKMVSVKGLAFGYGVSPAGAMNEAKKALGGYLVGIKFSLEQGILKASIEPFDSGMDPESDLSQFKAGSRPDGLYYIQWPVSAQVSRPLRLPAPVKGTILIAKDGAYVFPMVEQVVKAHSGDTTSSTKGMVYIKNLRYIPLSPQTPHGQISYEVILVESSLE